MQRRIDRGPLNRGALVMLWKMNHPPCDFAIAPRHAAPSVNQVRAPENQRFRHRARAGQRQVKTPTALSHAHTFDRPSAIGAVCSRPMRGGSGTRFACCVTQLTVNSDRSETVQFVATSTGSETCRPGRVCQVPYG
jgi:hypothetical protein